MVAPVTALIRVADLLNHDHDSRVAVRMIVLRQEVGGVEDAAIPRTQELTNAEGREGG